MVAEVHSDMRRKELLAVLISVLAIQESIDIQDEAAFAIGNLAKDLSNKVDIRKAGGIKALVGLLESADPDVKKNTAMALSILLDDFSNRSEIRYSNGIGSLIELLTSEYPEVQENGLLSLIKCAEDFSNRNEIRKHDGIRRLLELVSQDVSDVHSVALQCLNVCLEDNDTASLIAELGGLAPLIRIVSCDDSKVRKASSLCIAKSCKNDRNQIFARENGALSLFTGNLGHSDPATVSSAAVALAQLAKNDANQIELFKLSTSDILTRLLNSDDVEIRRESVAALGNLCMNAKIRARVRGTEGIAQVIKLLSNEDAPTVTNAAECIVSLAEDLTTRIELNRLSVIPSLLTALEKQDPKIAGSVCLAIARCTQETEGQLILSKQPVQKGIQRLVELVSSKDNAVSRNATYALSMCSQLELNAAAACNGGIIEALIQVQKDVSRNTKFATDALQKLLNHNLSAKYWLGNALDAENIITDGFYDVGFAGTNLDSVQTFPFLLELQHNEVDKRREVIVIDSISDSLLSSILTFASEAITGKSPALQIQILAAIVTKVMGGPIDPDQLSEFAFKFIITELKLKLESNVIPIGHIHQGTFYHRALLFKVLCDRLGLMPCELVRGEYNRAWNVIEVKRLSASSIKFVATTSLQNKPPSSRARSSTVLSTAVLSTLPTAPNPIESLLTSMVLPREAPVFSGDQFAIIDLMFEPGRLLPVESLEALKYQRMS